MAHIMLDQGPDLLFKHCQFVLDGPESSTSSVGHENHAGERDKKITCHSYHPAELSIWQRVDLELVKFESVHHRFWWSRHTGKALAILLYNAGYPEKMQYWNLRFFAQVVAPYLGVSQEIIQGDMPIWPSFMTDDGTPVELSWDWGTMDAPPVIRYSIEPIGLHAGTSIDPRNFNAGSAFQERLVCSLPTMRLEWFHHFKNFFIMKGDDFQEGTSDHKSSIFYGFDCSKSEAEVTPKVYFFPKLRANASGQSNLEVLFQAMRTAPHVTDTNFKAGKIFHEFCSDVSNRMLEHEILAIDLIDPLRSRLKIYFRSRETTLESVKKIMTLDGRIRIPKLHEGLLDLQGLWNALFGVNAMDQPLCEVEHRTSGILYNVEFRLGDALPVAKIYLPVRHYSPSDEAVIRGLNNYFQGRKDGKYMPNYIKVMRALFDSKSMEEKSGVQTYVGCAIRPDGTLKVISYFKPQVSSDLT